MTISQELNQLVKNITGSDVQSDTVVESLVEVLKALNADNQITPSDDTISELLAILAEVLPTKLGIVPTGTISITENGTGIDVTEYASANVAVPQPTGTISITANGTGIDVAEYASADVAVPQPTGTLNISQEGTYDVTQYASVVVDLTPETT